MNVLKQKYEEAKAFVAMYEAATGNNSEPAAKPEKKAPAKEVINEPETAAIDSSKMLPLAEVMGMASKERNEYCREVLGIPWKLLRAKDTAIAAIKEAYKAYPNLTSAGAKKTAPAPAADAEDYSKVSVMTLKKKCTDLGLEVPKTLQSKAFYIELLSGGSPEQKAEAPKEKKAPAKPKKTAPKAEATPYDDMTPKEMFMELKERGFAKGTVKPNQPSSYYIDILLKDDAKRAAEADDGWNDVADDDDDNWNI